MAREKKQHLKQRKDGRFRAVYGGKQFMGNTEEEALALRDAYKAAQKLGQELEENGTTVFAYASSWLPVHKAAVGKGTYNSYVNYLNTLVRQIGKKPMKDVTPSDIKAVYSAYLGKSDSAIRKARMLYVALWDCAIEDGICKSNPCRSKGAQPHKGTSGSHRALSQEEDDIILTHPAKLRMAALLMRYAGLRRGEAMAFDIDKNVDFSRNIIIIKEAVHFEGNKGIMSDPKTAAGVREIPLLDILRDELAGKHGPVCPMKRKKVVTSSGWRAMWDHYIMEIEGQLNGCAQKRWFHLKKDWIADHPEEYQKYLRLKAKNPKAAEIYRLRDWKSFNVRPHDLRHGYCTMLRDAGVDVKIAVKWMGHADEKMILRIYDHPGEKRERDAVENLNRQLFQVQNKVQEEHKDSGTVET